MRRETLTRARKQKVVDYLKSNPGSSAGKIADAIGLLRPAVYDCMRAHPSIFYQPSHGQWCLRRDLWRWAPPVKPKKDWKWWEHFNALVASDYANAGGEK